VNAFFHREAHSTEVTELSAHRLGSMGTTVRENVHLGDVLVCTGSFAISTVFVVFCCSFRLHRLQFGLFPIRAVFRLRVPIFDGSVWPNTINDPKRIMAQHEQLCGGLEPLGPDFRVPGRVRPFQ